MFDNNVRTEAIPERVLELCKIICAKSMPEADVKELLEPQSLPSASNYFTIVRDAAIELKLIEKDGTTLQFVGEKSNIKSLDAFRFYCNSVVWKNENTFFYKIGEAFLSSNDRWFGENITSIKVLSEVRERVSKSVIEQMLLGERFWLSFLGFGYVNEVSQKIVFLPNMYIAMKDFINMCRFEKNKEYSVREFISAIREHSKVAFDGVYDTRQLNLAASNALRQLDKNREIILKKNLDSKEKWNLYKLETQNISEITHIVFRGLAK